MVDTMVWLVVAPFRGKGLRWRSSVEHFVEFGVRSLPIVGMICFLIGVIIALQSSYTLDQWGANRFIADLVAVSALRELAPLMTAILITGRSGSAITAEIGTMKVGEEIDALEVMGLNPIKYLVVPKFLAMMIAVPCVTVDRDVHHDHRRVGVGGLRGRCRSRHLRRTDGRSHRREGPSHRA